MRFHFLGAVLSACACMHCELCLQNSRVERIAGGCAESYCRQSFAYFLS